MINYIKVSKNLKIVVFALVIVLIAVTGVACNKASTTNGGKVAVSPQNKQVNAIKKVDETKCIPLVLKFKDEKNKDINKIGYWDLDQGKVVFDVKGSSTLLQSYKVGDMLITKKEQSDVLKTSNIKEIDYVIEKSEKTKWKSYLVYKNDLNKNERILIPNDLSCLDKKYSDFLSDPKVGSVSLDLFKNKDNQIRIIETFGIPLSFHGEDSSGGDEVLATAVVENGKLKNWKIIELQGEDLSSLPYSVIEEHMQGDNLVLTKNELKKIKDEQGKLSKNELISKEKAENDAKWLYELICRPQDKLEKNKFHFVISETMETSQHTVSRFSQLNVIEANESIQINGEKIKMEQIEAAKHSTPDSENNVEYWADIDGILVKDDQDAILGALRLSQYDLPKYDISESSIELYDSAKSLLYKYNVPTDLALAGVELLKGYEVTNASLK